MLRSAKVREEHEIVARRIARALRPHSVWVQTEDEPAVVKRRQHPAPGDADPGPARRLALGDRAGRAAPSRRRRSAASRAEAAIELIDELEGLDRGWYAGPVGWMDATEDGEFCVALRSALLRDRTAHLYAGCGIVAGSDPADELAETEIKLEALLPLIAG